MVETIKLKKYTWLVMIMSHVGKIKFKIASIGYTISGYIY